MENQIWIPAQTSSQRITKKNIRPFHNQKSLLEIKIDQLCDTVPAECIFVSSNGIEVEEICDRLGVNFILRPEELLGNAIMQKNLFEHFLRETPQSDSVGWIQVTDPLYDDFNELFSVVPQVNEVRVVASELKKHVFFKGYPINFQFGDWHEVTQSIEPVLVPRWSGFYARRATFEKYKYHFGKVNTFIPTQKPFVDIDYPEDFELAQHLYGKLVA